MKLLFCAYKLATTAKGIPQITRPIRILIKIFIVEFFLSDFAALSLKNKDK
jgi:hypothetical protein